ncbi:MAG: hypothetical protein LBK25_04380 [Treponema sp.]|nr:hypothetical protein [Treponema sp.]
MAKRGSSALCSLNCSLLFRCQTPMAATPRCQMQAYYEVSEDVPSR